MKKNIPLALLVLMSASFVTYAYLKTKEAQRLFDMKAQYNEELALEKQKALNLAAEAKRMQAEAEAERERAEIALTEWQKCVQGK